jgi:hypothetical protein
MEYELGETVNTRFATHSKRSFVGENSAEIVRGPGAALTIGLLCFVGT